MRLFLYYVSHSLFNTIKKLMKTWVAFIIIAKMIRRAIRNLQRLRSFSTMKAKVPAKRSPWKTRSPASLPNPRSAG